jgi:hypothetical protein
MGVAADFMARERSAAAGRVYRDRRRDQNSLIPRPPATDPCRDAARRDGALSRGRVGCGVLAEGGHVSLSKKDAALAAQARNFAAVLAADPGVYATTAPVAAEVTVAVNAYVDSVAALVEARANGVRSEQMTAARNANRRAMLNVMRPIYGAVQASVAISDADKLALGVHVKATRRTREPVPSVAPLLSVTRVDGSVVSLRVRDPEQPDRKGRPPRTEGISIFTHVGAAPPDDPSAMRFEMNTGRVSVDVPFPASVPTGATVWFVASFFNSRKESGPTCTPVRATIGAGSTMPAQLPMLKAA